MERRKRQRSASCGRKGERKDDRRKEGRESRLDIEREKVSSEFGGEEKLVVDEAERKMDKLEGAIRAEEEDVCLIYQDDTDLEGKVHDTLWRHARFWKETGALEFAISVIENGYVPQLWDNPEKYEEENNKSYKNEKDWANDAVRKLKEAKLVKEVRKEELWCINPLTVASN